MDYYDYYYYYFPDARPIIYTAKLRIDFKVYSHKYYSKTSDKKIGMPPKEKVIP